MKKGDIVLVPFPFTDLSTIKNRPSLILVTTKFDVTVSFITTQINSKNIFDIDIEPSLYNGLKKRSIIKLDKLITLSQDLIIGRLGSLEQDRFRELDNNLIKVFKIESQFV